ncbi:hypothetical protein N9099_02290 [Mariniblastus sp.]|nr:hypothetical protein [Mariniblastus sp.]
MRWSKLKQMIESGLAAEVSGRISFHTTRYRNAHDGMGRSWITVDDVEIINMHHLSGPAASEGPDRLEHGVFAAYDLPVAMTQFLNMNIDAALASNNPLIRALAVVDRRTGQRRIQSMDSVEEVFPVNAFISLRQEHSDRRITNG